MKTLLFILIVLVSLFLIFDYFTKPYVNPYKLIMVFGKKGSGKTTFLTKVAINSINAGKTVYSTIKIPGTILFNPDKIGRFQFKPNSVVLIDEVGMIWDNRNYKEFKPEVRDQFKLQRHDQIIVYLFSQTFDIDKKLRDLTDEMYLLENHLRVWSIAKHIDKRITITKAIDSSGEKQNSTLIEDYKFTPFIFPGARIITFIPRWTSFYDSHERDNTRNKMPGIVQPFAKGTRKYLDKKVWKKDHRAYLINKVKASLKATYKTYIYPFIITLPRRFKVTGLYGVSIFLRLYDSLKTKFTKQKSFVYQNMLDRMDFEKQQINNLMSKDEQLEYDHRFDYLDAVNDDEEYWAKVDAKIAHDKEVAERLAKYADELEEKSDADSNKKRDALLKAYEKVLNNSDDQN